MDKSADAPVPGCRAQYDQKINNELGLFPIGSGLSKRKQLYQPHHLQSECTVSHGHGT
jgi:hypothetical protein